MTRDAVTVTLDICLLAIDELVRRGRTLNEQNVFRVAKANMCLGLGRATEDTIKEVLATIDPDKINELLADPVEPHYQELGQGGGG